MFESSHIMLEPWNGPSTHQSHTRTLRWFHVKRGSMTWFDLGMITKSHACVGAPGQVCWRSAFTALTKTDDMMKFVLSWVGRGVGQGWWCSLLIVNNDHHPVFCPNFFATPSTSPVTFASRNPLAFFFILFFSVFSRPLCWGGGEPHLRGGSGRGSRLWGGSPPSGSL